ncbi:GNAT family N-acetyltransferase [Actinoplanes aureus]|jgi:GNAT superfamily N-acetyltransferase|uniref:GNAT family N-acetyltransferase n=1 Tax=Actinoplanes aureus TaxID=2792083 RepID=A0A931BYT6_9ACTN|nr:GNAT family N-acetyltransferase [Actinoplanes aureus]MBG0560045.1 GNAT family N-acetyltransferase [Actinoplanes aureus]
MALWRVRATVDDRPGYLSVLTASLALRSVNILAVQVHTTEEGAVDDFLVDAPDMLTESDIMAAVVKGRGRDAFVTRADPQSLADQPTRALALAGRLVHEPESLGETLAALLDATEVRWRPAATADRPGFHGGRMTLADPAGGAYEVLRALPAFTPAEYARAQSLVEVAGTVLRQHREQVTMLLPDGTELVLRPAGKDDLAAVRELHEDCSPTTLHRRYLGGAVPDESRLGRMLEPPGGVTLLAVAPGGPVVAMATLLAEGDLGEVAVLVEDAWQRRGLGTALLRRLHAHAGRAGLAALVAHVAAGDAAMLDTLRRLGAERFERDGTVVSATLPAAGRPVGDETPATSG